MSLEDIWSETLVDPAPISPDSHKEVNGAQSYSSSRPALFLSESEDGNGDDGSEGPSRILRGSRPPAEQPGSLAGNAEIQAPDKDMLDAMFSGFDDDDPFGDIGPAVDIGKLKRQADASLSATRNMISSTDVTSLDDVSNLATGRGNEGGPKPRKVIPKLDEERLLGPDGFPRLLKEYKNFKITGKGHEAADLERLFRIYHAWAHKMYPKFQFKDAVDRVEKLCRTRRMTVNLRVWRDEAHGISPDIQHRVAPGSDGSDHEDGGRSGDDGPRNAPTPGAASPPQTGTPNTRSASEASAPPSAPPSSDTEGDNDMDIDALLREEEEIMQGMNGDEKVVALYKPSTVHGDDGGDDDALWAAAGGISDDIPAPRRAPDSRPDVDDADMWDIFDEIEQPAPTSALKDNEKTMKAAMGVSQESTASSNGPSLGSLATPADSIVLHTASEQPTIGADWDDMYA